MHTYVRLKDGEIWVVWSDNSKEETMDIYPLSMVEWFNPEWDAVRSVSYSEVDETDTNLSVLQR